MIDDDGADTLSSALHPPAFKISGLASEPQCYFRRGAEAEERTLSCDYRRHSRQGVEHDWDAGEWNTIRRIGDIE